MGMNPERRRGGGGNPRSRKIYLRSNVPIIVLLAEDSPDDVFFFGHAIQKTGLHSVVHVAADGHQAKDYLLHQGRFADPAAYPPPDIMFLDLKMPHCNGFEVLEWMNFAQCPPTPVVVLTSSILTEDEARSKALGAALYLIKPPTPEKLRQVLLKFATTRSMS
jgi:two-component system, response regulator